MVMLLTNPATFDQRPLKEAHTLARAGWKVTILAWDRELEAPRDSAFPDGLLIKRMRVGAGHGTPLLTVPKLLLFYLWCASHLLFGRTDAIHCHDVDTLIPGFFAKAAKGMRPRLVYDMHDLPEAFLRFFPLTRAAQGIFLASARRMADAILVVNERFVAHLVKLGFREQRLVVVMNAPPASAGRPPRPKRSGEGFEVLYYGWMGEERGVKLLVEAVSGLGGVTLTLAGRGELEGWVRMEAAKDERIRYLGWLNMDELGAEVRRADLIPSLYEPRTKNAMMATPGKLLTAMSLSIPSLVPLGTYQAEVVERNGCGVAVDWNDPGEVRRAIQQLSADRELYGRLSEGAHRAFLSYFSWEAMEERLRAAYGRLLTS